MVLHNKWNRDFNANHDNNSLSKVDLLRSKYPIIRYQYCELAVIKTSLQITYQYQIDGLDSFTTSWSIPIHVPADQSMLVQVDPIVQKLALSLGLVELLSYWKMTCSPQIIVEAGAFSETELMFFKKLLVKGMGEYFYRNEIAILETDIVTFGSMNEKVVSEHASRPSMLPIRQGILIPIGGGKDSIVTLDILRKHHSDVKCYMINPRLANTSTAVIAGCADDQIVTVQRNFDSKMLTYNKQGFLNGHTPFSALVAFSSVLSAYLNGCDTVALSNESSANEATVAGTDVNHQYSKSYEFESNFASYLNQHISDQLHYFSFLRPLSEYQIGQYFARLSKYHQVFRSCNLGSKNDAWCNHCAKCLYVYVLLSAFLSLEQLVAIFGEDLLQRQDMKDEFDSLVGMTEEKPFECVGSIDEINMAIIEAITHYEQAKMDLPFLYAYYQTSKHFALYQKQTNPYLQFYDTKHLLPTPFLAILKKEFNL